MLTKSCPSATLGLQKNPKLIDLTPFAQRIKIPQRIDDTRFLAIFMEKLFHIMYICC